MSTYGPNDQDPPEESAVKVYIAENTNANAETDWLYLWDAYTGEQLSERPERYRHNLIELANANGWEIVDGPIQEDDDEVVDSSFDWYDEVGIEDDRETDDA